MLHPAQSLRGLNHPPQTIVVKLVGRGASRASVKNGAHRDHVVLVGNILMDSIVREASKGKSSAREKNFDLVSTRELSNAVKDVSGMFPGQHLDLAFLCVSVSLW